MSDKDLLKKKEDLVARADVLNAENEKLQEVINENQREIRVRKEELIRLQGEYRLVEELLSKDEEKPKK